MTLTRLLAPVAVLALLCAPAAAPAGTVSGVSGTLDVTVVGAALAAGSVNNGVTDSTTTRVTISSDSTGSLNVRPLAAGTPITASSSNQANANAVATLAGVSAKTTYITGFQCTASGATSGLPVTLTVAGVVTGTMNFTFTFPAGVLVAAQPLVVAFPQPVPASAVNTAIVVTLPAGGTGATNATCSAQGFQL